MKKFIIALVVLGFLAFGLSSGMAEPSRTIVHKYRTVTTNTVVSSQGCTVYKVTGYANASNAIFALANVTTTAGAPATTAVLVEGGEATQYDGLPTLDFGDEGIPFNTGLTVFTVGAYVSVEYN